MKFAKSIYLGAGLYGLLVLIPQYFVEARHSINHPEYYYGFIGVAVAWQICFLLISRESERYATLMITTVIEKYSYGFAVLVLYKQGRVTSVVLLTGLIDLILGTLFAIAYQRVTSYGRVTRPR